MVEFFYEDLQDLDLEKYKIDAWLNTLCAHHKRKLGDLNLVFCSDEYLLGINQTHLNHDYYTDIITFDYCHDLIVSGDLFISIDRVRDNAEVLNEMFHVELFRVIAHGVLHLLGFGDKTEEDANVMRNQENFALDLFVSRETRDH